MVRDSDISTVLRLRVVSCKLRMMFKSLLVPSTAVACTGSQRQTAIIRSVVGLLEASFLPQLSSVICHLRILDT